MRHETGVAMARALMHNGTLQGFELFLPPHLPDEEVRTATFVQETRIFGKIISN